MTPTITEAHLQYLRDHIRADFDRGILFLDGVETSGVEGKVHPHAMVYIPVKPLMQLSRGHIMWFLKHNKWPHPTIDHKNRIKSDDRIDNLREASHSTQMLNRPFSFNRPYPPGIRKLPSGKFVAYIWRKGKHDQLGSSLNLDEAIEMLEAARKDYGIEVVL